MVRAMVWQSNADDDGQDGDLIICGTAEFAFLCERNSISDNPAVGVSRPKEGANEGKTPALSDDQARALLKAPLADTWQGKRDRAMLAVLLYHELRATEMCSLRVKDYAAYPATTRLYDNRKDRPEESPTFRAMY